MECPNCRHEFKDAGSAWRLVSEELPELSQIVWLSDGKEIWIGGRGLDSEAWVWCNSYNTIWHNGKIWDGDLIHDDDYQPTRWMPLPDLPNVAGETEEARN